MLGNSELILTPEGCIYHLDLLPEEIADTVITVGDPGRVQEVSKHFDRIEVQKSHREFITHTGYIGNKRVCVISTGIGPDNIDIVLNELDALVNIDLDSRTEKPVPHSLKIIRLGTSGALQQDIETDQVVVSTFGIGLDNLLHYYKHEYNAEESYILNDFKNHTLLHGNPVQPYIAEGSIQLLNKFSGNFIHGITVTCPGFFAPQGRRIRLPLTFPNLVDKLADFESGGHHRITNFEMETSAIYGLGKLMGHQCISINSIIANRQTKTFSKNPAAAVNRMIEDSLEIISGL
ncbi:phosphorylase [Taibaiella lutea]|uniref:Uridine phosphorylase n=1 Tax=Taibaiella lutea TaxID=2608001 RepID=A0A5M6CBF9_9BACT|nr:nucleoside phosphorylase [Taibaiella lutea]KAA5532467.1 phosphorylase [Taibaiella lutea]